MPRFQLTAPGLSEPDSMVDLALGLEKQETQQSAINLRTLTQMGVQDEREYNKAKGTVASLINSFHTAGSQTLQDQIVYSMKDYYNALPTSLRKAVDPYIAHGPTSPAEEKRREFLKFNPPPSEPELTTGPSSEVLPLYEQRTAEYLFNASDHKRKLDAFTYGSEAAGERLAFIPLKDGRAAIRNKEGQVVVLNQADLGLKELQEKHGFTPREVLLNPDGIPTGKKGFTIVNGRRINVEQTFKPFESDPSQQYGQRITGVDDIPKSAWDIKHPDELTSFLLDWKSSTKAAKEKTDELKKLALKDPVEAAQALSLTFNQYSFRIVPMKPGATRSILSRLPYVSANSETALIPIRGKPFPLLDMNKKKFQYYYDQSIDLVSNEFGQPVGSLEQATQEAGVRDLTKSRLGGS